MGHPGDAIMSLTPLASTTLGVVTIKDSCGTLTANNLLLVEGTTPTVRQLSATTLAFISSSAILSAPAGVSMINTSSAIINSSLNTTWDLVEIATMYRQNYAGGATVSTSRGGQCIAGDPSTNIAIGVSSTRNIVRFSGSSFSATVITLPINSNDIVKCVILKGPNRWLVGTNLGVILEVDSNGYIWDTFNLRLNTWPLGGSNPLSGGTGIAAYQLAYDNNMLLVETGVSLLLLDWSTKTTLKTFAPEAGATISPVTMCNASSGVILFSPLVAAQQIVYEMDITVSPLTVRSFCFMDSTATMAAVNMASGYGWWVDQSSPAKLRSFAVTPRDTTLKTVTVMSASSGGVHQAARLTIVDDTSGVGTSQVILDTYMQSPAIYRVPTSRTLMEATKVGLGSIATLDLNRYNT